MLVCSAEQADFLVFDGAQTQNAAVLRLLSGGPQLRLSGVGRRRLTPCGHAHDLPGMHWTEAALA